MSTAPARPCAFLDRDGIINVDVGYLCRTGDFEFMPGMPEAIKMLNDAGWLVIVITNQSGIGRGYFGWDAYEAVAARFREMLAAEGIAFDAEAVCGHAPDHPCDWRKPAPGMILAAAEALNLDLPSSTLVGDRLGDLQAGLTAGVGRLAHVATGEGVAGRESVIESMIKAELLNDISGLRP